MAVEVSDVGFGHLRIGRVLDADSHEVALSVVEDHPGGGAIKTTGLDIVRMLFRQIYAGCEHQPLHFCINPCVLSW